MTLVPQSGTDQLRSFGERLRKRLEPGKGERQGRPSDPTWTLQRKLSMKEEMLVSPMQIAALLIEDAVHGLAKQLN